MDSNLVNAKVDVAMALATLMAATHVAADNDDTVMVNLLNNAIVQLQNAQAALNNHK